MATGKFTTADISAPASGQTGQFSASDIDGNSQPKRGAVSQWLHDTFAPRPATSMPGATSTTQGGMPGSFEGHPENVGEYLPASAGQIGKGAIDIGRGNIAKGTHEVISGAGNAALPALPFVAAAAPGAAARTLVGSAVGSELGRKGAELVDASPDQQDLAGDIGGIVGGGAGARAPELTRGRLGQSFGVLGKSATKLPFVRSSVEAAKQLGDLKDIWFPEKPSPSALYGPPAPSQELTQASSLLDAGKPTPPEPSAGLGSIPVRRGSVSEMMQPEKPQPITRGKVQSMLEESLGASPPPNPKAPIYQRTPAATAETPASDLPEGHTPVQSSALRSYRYDPQAREFHARATSGDTTYVYGDVSPEDAQAFEQAESKGKAWQQIRNNPLVAKIVNGKRVSVRPSGGEDLTSEIQQSVAAAKAKRGAIAEKMKQ